MYVLLHPSVDLTQHHFLIRVGVIRESITLTQKHVRFPGSRVGFTDPRTSGVLICSTAGADQASRGDLVQQPVPMPVPSTFPLPAKPLPPPRPPKLVSNLVRLPRLCTRHVGSFERMAA